MKKIKIIALLFLLASCNGYFKTDYAIINQVVLAPDPQVEPTGKYRVYFDTEGWDTYFYTDKQYKAGDTIYFSTKPQ